MEVIKCRNDTLSLLIMFHLMFIKLGIMLGFSAYAHSSPSGAFFPFYRGENGVIKKADDLAWGYAKNGKARVQKPMLLISVQYFNFIIPVPYWIVIENKL